MVRDWIIRLYKDYKAISSSSCAVSKQNGRLVLLGSFVHLVQELCLVLRRRLPLFVRDAMSTMVTQTEVWEVGDSEPAGFFFF